MRKKALFSIKKNEVENEGDVFSVGRSRLTDFPDLLSPEEAKKKKSEERK